MDKMTNTRLKEIYNLLYNSLGSRNWWPAETSFEVIIGAILVQFVAWKNVETAIINLQKAGIFSIDDIYEADDEVLEELIRSTRFYKQKVKKLKELCRFLKEKYEGDLNKFFMQDIETMRQELLSLYGIGEETADSIILYAANKPIFVVDAYTRRIFSRLGIFSEDITYGQMQKFFMDNLEQDTGLYNDFHAQIVYVGNHFCKNKSPECQKCPLDKICEKKGVVNVKKQVWKPSTILNPVPVVMVTCIDKDGKPNIITLGWVGTINSEPPMLSISVRKERYSYSLIKEQGEFVVNLTNKKLAKATDYCGVASGKNVDKFKETGLTPYESSIVKPPMILESPVCIECKVKDVIELGSHDLFIAEIVSVSVDDKYIDEKGKLQLEKADLICYSHGEYFELGKSLGFFGFSVRKKKVLKREKTGEKKIQKKQTKRKKQ